jgi:hypothetical protein
MAYRLITLCLPWAFVFALAWGAAPLAADDNKTEKRPEVAVYFHTGAGDTKETRLPKGTRIRLRVEAGDYDYDYDGTTIEGETVGDIAEQIQSSLAFYGWDAVLLKSGLGVAVYGGAPTASGGPRPYKTVTRAGIHYSTPAQPLLPEARGGAQLLTFEKGKWKPLPKPK